MILEFRGALPNQQIIMSKKNLVEEANCVLIFAFYEGRIVITRHKNRGWELPGGTKKVGEPIIQTALREMYEETGGELDSIEKIGQYLIMENEELNIVKNIYVARVAILRGLPVGFETDSVKLLNVLPEYNQIIDDPSYSPLMKDEVYPTAVKWIVNHRFTIA